MKRGIILFHPQCLYSTMNGINSGWLWRAFLWEIWNRKSRYVRTEWSQTELQECTRWVPPSYIHQRHVTVVFVQEPESSGKLANVEPSGSHLQSLWFRVSRRAQDFMFLVSSQVTLMLLGQDCIVRTTPHHPCGCWVTPGGFNTWWAVKAACANWTSFLELPLMLHEKCFLVTLSLM